LTDEFAADAAMAERMIFHPIAKAFLFEPSQPGKTKNPDFPLAQKNSRGCFIAEFRTVLPTSVGVT